MVMEVVYRFYLCSYSFALEFCEQNIVANYNMASNQPVRNPRDMRKLCLLDPGKFGQSYHELREICRPFGQLLHFQWDGTRKTYAFVLYNTEK